MDKLNEIAAIGSGFEVHGSEGELALLFEGELVEAGDFLAKVDANPRLYYAVNNAIEATTALEYSERADNVLGDRSAFSSWQSSGDPEEDQKNFEAIAAKRANATVIAMEIGGCPYYDDEGSIFCRDGSANGEASEIVGTAVYVADGDNTSAEQLLNSGMASMEPWRAGDVFMTVGSAGDRSKVSDGPANELFTMLQKSTEVTYTDANTKTAVKDKRAMVEAPNFSALYGGGFDYETAASFRNDRVYLLSGESDTSVIKDTTISTDGKKNSNVVTRKGVGSADVYTSEDTVGMAMTGYTSETMTSIIGGERVSFGGGYLAGMVSQSVFGGLGMNNLEAAKYIQKINDWEDKRIAAERAVKSPFDISSQYTFMGSIVHNLAVSMLTSGAGGGTLLNAAKTVASATGSATKGLTDGAMADGSDDSYMNTLGKGCDTNDSAGAVSTLNCTRYTGNETKYIEKSGSWWEKNVDKGEYKNYVLYNTDRLASIGTKDASTCEKYKDENPTIGIPSVILEFLGIWDACTGVPDGVSMGSKYVLGEDEEVSKIAGYALYDAVNSAIEGKKSEAALILEEYYAEHPEDKSRSGVFARKTGMTIDEADLALGYADYLTFVARYDASDRYAFGVDIEVPSSMGLVKHSSKINGDLYCFWRGRNEYADARNRNLIV